MNKEKKSYDVDNIMASFSKTLAIVIPYLAVKNFYPLVSGSKLHFYSNSG